MGYHRGLMHIIHQCLLAQTEPMDHSAHPEVDQFGLFQDMRQEIQTFLGVGKALLASATGAMTLGISHKPRDVAISYMSYAHLFERSLFTIYKISGCAIGFATSAVTMM